MVKINGKDYDYTMFAFDGCHKIYLLKDEEGKRTMEGFGYEGADFHPIEELDKVFWNTCSLRFMEDGVTLESIVPQCEEVVTVEVAGRKVKMDFANDVLTVNGKVA